jgi:NifB/MoaA-like Fe-S oxidoreductase
LSQSNNQKTFTRFENQYILMLAVRAKQDLMLEFEEENRKIKIYGNTQSFIDPNIRNYIEALTDIIEKAKSNMGEYDKWELEE